MQLIYLKIYLPQPVVCAAAGAGVQKTQPSF